MKCSHLAVARSFFVHLSWSRTIIGWSKPIWEAIGVGQISRLDQKVMYLEGEIHRIGHEIKWRKVTWVALRFLICPSGWMIPPLTEEREWKGTRYLGGWSWVEKCGTWDVWGTAEEMSHRQFSKGIWGSEEMSRL